MPIIAYRKSEDILYFDIIILLNISILKNNSAIVWQ